MNTVKTYRVLYIDDDSDDLEMLDQAFRSLYSESELLQAQNGEEGLELLAAMRREDKLPCLIVLDINMPKLDGKQVFKRIKADEVLRAIPIVIFSTSDNAMDKMFFKARNVEYITKPLDYKRLLAVAKRLVEICDDGME